MSMNKSVDTYLKKMKRWKDETKKLRTILLKTKLEEDFKWRLPCYAVQGHNVAIIQPFKSCLALMFFKGSLLKDRKKILVPNGPNSRSGMRFEFRSVEEVAKLAATIKAYVNEAIMIEQLGKKVSPSKPLQTVPTELKKIFKKNTAFKKAFRALTPGRQRAYLLHFSGAKQSSTRQARIEKCMPRILDGKGLMDR